MPSLTPDRIAPESRSKSGRKASAPRADKGKRAARPQMTDREAQAASFTRRRRVQAIRRISTAVGTSVVVIGGLWLWQAGQFPVLAAAASDMVPSVSDLSGLTVNEVEVTGTKNLELEEVILASGVEDGQKIGDIDLTVVREQVESIGWVRKARVSRILPGTIQIDISERVPYAFWQDNRKLRLIDREGVEITKEGLAHFAKLPLVVGEGAPRHARSLFEIMESEPSLAARVQAAVRVGNRRWDLRFDNGVNVQLPETDADKAWHRLAALDKNEGLLSRDVATIDMRLADRMTVRQTPEAAQARRDAEAAAAKAAKALREQKKS
ncbi:cell division protein FtsQ/DivIB [Iodidimonas sp. SYSU 1G8]|uniref:cell division protein FtsQ/DivIB n=1 Tax=Iodidimonas sp. SYSU 1G8 TaxID=3133967 RepID=UPI0031FEC578